jgi:transposase
MKDSITIVGMDVHKNSISIALAETSGNNEIRHYGRIGGTMTALDMLVKTLVAKGMKPRFVYEAGPCGYEIYRHLTKKGFQCKVIAPSLTPRKAGDRIKNDTRDALTLARLERSGDLTEVIVPSEEDEAMRDLTRARQDAVKAQTTARQQLKSFLLRQGKRCPGTENWGEAHMRWITGISIELPVLKIVLCDYIDTVITCTDRVKKLDEEITRMLPAWKMAPVVSALQAMRGIGPVTASAIAAETGDMNRFPSPGAYMAFIGIIPSEHSTGDKILRGRITKTGNSHLRYALIEAAKQYSHKAAITKTLKKRQENLPRNVTLIAWKAQKRLCRRFLALVMRGKHRNITAVAIARELAGFVWALARQVPIAA